MDLSFVKTTSSELQKIEFLHSVNFAKGEKKHFGVLVLYDTILEGSTLNNISCLHPCFNNGQTVFQRGK